MSKNTGISWTDHTFNPWWGCSKISPACDNCYAERDAKRFAAGSVLWGVDAERRTFGDKHWAEPLKWNASAQRDGVRRRVFCASMADVFDKNAPDGARARLWQLIAATPALDWLLLTKRIGNAAGMMPANFGGQGFANVWLGATVVNQEEADRDVPKLLAVPARVRFLSIEPMLGPIDLQQACLRACGNGGTCYSEGVRRWVVDSSEGGLHVECICSRLNGLHWVIAGGESGARARPAHPGWFRSLRDQCSAAGVPFHFKQWGEWLPLDHQHGGADDGEEQEHIWPDGRLYAGSPELMKPACAQVSRVGRANAGRLLDGVTHDGFPVLS